MTIPMTYNNWRFFGRASELAALGTVLTRGGGFVLRVTGRRRIGKTTLVLEAIRRANLRNVAYIQLADADAAGLVASAREHLRMSGVAAEDLPTSLTALAACVGTLVRAHWVVILDEFQVFARSALYAFNSALQFEVDRFRGIDSPHTTGGIVLLGSIQTEMEALLSGRRAPLFGRCTDVLAVAHLLPTECAQILQTHGELRGEHLLFLWSILQGIPKYWRDAFEVQALGLPRRQALERLFFTGTAPLSAEGASWLADELRGRYDLLLRYLARNPDSSRTDIAAHVASVVGHADPQIGAWLGALEERFRLVQRRDPVLERTKTRNGRYAISDNFLVAWLGALADPVAFIGVRPLEALVEDADRRLATLEGFALERLAAELYHQRSAAGRGFALTERAGRWWERKGADVDLVAVDAERKVVRLGSCKRSPAKLIADLRGFEGNVARFLELHPQMAGWRVEKVAIAPELTLGERQQIERAGFLAEDLGQMVGEAQ